MDVMIAMSRFIGTFLSRNTFMNIHRRNYLFKRRVREADWGALNNLTEIGF